MHLMQETTIFKANPRCILIEQKYWRSRHSVQCSQGHMYNIENKERKEKKKFKSSIEMTKWRLQYEKEYGGPNKGRIKIEKYL